MSEQGAAGHTAQHNEIIIVRRHSDHFEPQDTDPHEQRRLRGQLEAIDYAAYVANREVIGQALPSLDPASLQKLAVLTAQART